MTKNIFNKDKENEIKETLKRCNPKVIEAAILYRKNKDTSLVPLIVIGIIERFLEAENKVKLKEKNYKEYKLIEDLGIDSLVMVEIVMTIEEVLDFSIPNEDLENLSTINDIEFYIQKRLNTQLNDESK